LISFLVESITAILKIYARGINPLCQLRK